MDLSIGGIPIMAVIVGLIEYLKKDIGVPAALCPALSMIMGVCAGIGNEFLKAWPVTPDLPALITGAIVGLALGMAATGLYKVAMKVSGNGSRPALQGGYEGIR